MGLIQTIKPAAEPLAVAEAREHLNIDGTDSDDQITAMIKAARTYVDTVCRRQLVIATWKLTLDEFPDVIRPSTPPLVSVTSLQYLDSNGDTQSLTEDTDFQVDTASEPGRILPCWGEVWPTTRNDIDAVTLTYVCGYATPFSANATTDICTWSGRNPTDGDSYVLTNSGGDLPAGLSANTMYYVRDASGATCKWAATAGGSAIDLTDAGTGTHFVGAIPENALAAIKLMLGDMYEHRDAQTEVKVVPNVTVDRLLWSARFVEAG